MKPFRLITLLAALGAAFGAQSLVAAIAAKRRIRAAAGGGPFDALHFRPIGPASMSGRIADIAVYETNTAIFYVGTAHGGVWKTTNNGTTFEAQFQDQGLMSIGDVTVSQNNPDLVWVGTGESNNRQSTSWGDGVYKSTDGGKTFTNIGLKTSHHINRIVIDPRNNDVVLVAATGPLFGPGRRARHLQDDRRRQDLEADAEGRRRHRRERSRDGSRPNNKILYASTYQRRRTACCMNGGGPGSGIWKSTDGGDTWTRLTERASRTDRSAASASTSIASGRTSSTRRSKARRRWRRGGRGGAAQAGGARRGGGRRRPQGGRPAAAAQRRGRRRQRRRPASIAPTTPARRGAR